MKPTPINMAEAVIEPFWDPRLSGLKEWKIENGAGHGLVVSQNWCWVGFEWSRKPRDGPALRMSRRFDLDCSSYDKLIVSVMPPERAVLRLTATTEKGTVSIETPPAPPLKKEHLLDLHGAGRLRTVTIEVFAGAEGIAAGWFNWLGLQNSQQLARYLEQWDRFDSSWEGYLKPETYEPEFTPTYGLLIGKSELARLRRRHEAFLEKHGKSPYTQAAAEAERLVPEKMIRDFVNFWGDTRYCRERDHGHLLLGRGPSAAIAGLLLRDRKLLRLGARYAMSIAMCGRWDDGMICHFPGSTFDHRCFVQSLCVYETALLLDLAGEMFTDLGRDFILRRIAEEGLGAINFNTWKYEYIFHCNQLAWFTPGRMLGYLLAERFWPRVKPYTELAYKDLVESLGYTILPDGGYVEGPTYFTCVGRSGGLPLYLYSRARRMPFESALPEPMKRTAGFAEAVASTTDDQDVIPICDAGTHLDHETLAVMASALPRSQWVTMFRKSLGRTGGMPSALLAFVLEPSIPKKGPPPRAFTSLPELGVISSVRRLGHETVKILIMGNRAGAGHTHEDKGSFVLEFAGETFAMDPGTCDYSNPLAEILKNCERHNMLVPSGCVDRPHPECPLPVDVKPRGRGNGTTFHASIDAAPGWSGYYRKWTRRWNSSHPDTLIIRDEYELATGDAVEFYWNTQREVQVAGNVVTLTGKRGVVTIEAPQDCTIRVDELTLPGGAIQRRIAVRKDGTAGTIELVARISCLRSKRHRRR